MCFILNSLKSLSFFVAISVCSGTGLWCIQISAKQKALNSYTPKLEWVGMGLILTVLRISCIMFDTENVSLY